MFSQVCVCLSTGGGGPHVTITHDALALTVQGPSWPWTPPDMGHGTPGPAPASDIWWPSLETCSNLFIGPHCTAPLQSGTDIW